jgi:ADP-ribose pyrophosphatase
MAGDRRDMESMEPKSIILDHRDIYRGKIVRLYVDTIQYASGRTAVREVVAHPGGVAAVPVLEDGRIILVRQFRYPLGKYILELPAGKLDSNQSPAETMHRELEEETGYRAGELSYECGFYSTPGVCDEVIHLFIARSLTPVVQRLEEGEHITVEMHTLEECLREMGTGTIADGKTILGILWYRAKIGLK